MEKKNLKFYESPAVEAMEMLTEGFLCGSTNAENASVEDLVEEPEE